MEPVEKKNEKLKQKDKKWSERIAACYPEMDQYKTENNNEKIITIKKIQLYKTSKHIKA